jgi:hypothetical protein
VRHLDLRLKPELRLAIGAIDMNMGPRLLPREEVKAKNAFTKDCGTHVTLGLLFST